MSDDMRVKDIMNELDRIILEVGKMSAQRDELLSALKDLWEWASEGRYEEAQTPPAHVPDGLGAQVIRAIENNSRRRDLFTPSSREYKRAPHVVTERERR